MEQLLVCASPWWQAALEVTSAPHSARSRYGFKCWKETSRIRSAAGDFDVPTSILIVDDHPLFVEALKVVIESAFPDAAVAEATSIDSARAELEKSGPFDLMLLDLSMPGTRGLDGLIELRTRHPKLPIVVVSALEDTRIIHEVMTCGAAGFISKSTRGADLGHAIREVLAGSVVLPKGYEPPQANAPASLTGDLAARLATLTPQQVRVLHMLRQGLLNKQIAYDLGVGETTVKAHVSEILRKLKVSSRTQAVIEAAKIDFDTIIAQSFGDDRERG
jgi:DNA-binding NarL/FixJ family response regulator